MKTSAKNLLVLAILAAVSATAFAEAPPPQRPDIPTPVVRPPSQHQSQTASGVGIAFGGASSSTSAASAAGGNASAQGGDASNSLSLRMDAQLRDPVSTATAPALAVANGTCMGSTSAGVQSVALGVSIGGTWVDKGCDTRYDALLLVQMGLTNVAVKRLCQKPEIERALKDAGHPCTVPAESHGEAQILPQYTDPIVRRRMGLPPL